jgi:hypothetical protein
MPRFREEFAHLSDVAAVIERLSVQSVRVLLITWIGTDQEQTTTCK